MSHANAQLAARFQQMADVMEILGENRFKIIAFQKVVRVLSELSEDVAAIEPAALIKIEGIGKGAGERIGEFIQTGQIADHHDLLAQIPAGLPALMDIPGLGPKTIAVLWRDGGVKDLPSLKAKLQTGELESLSGFGKKKAQNLIKSLAFAESAGKRVRIGAALPLAQWIVEQLRKIKAVKNVAYAGSRRPRKRRRPNKRCL
jgi:DNA polymerase (family 10)